MGDLNSSLGFSPSRMLAIIYDYGSPTSAESKLLRGLDTTKIVSSTPSMSDSVGLGWEPRMLFTSKLLHFLSCLPLLASLAARGGHVTYSGQWDVRRSLGKPVFPNPKGHTWPFTLPTSCLELVWSAWRYSSIYEQHAETGRTGR